MWSVWWIMYIGDEHETGWKSVHSFIYWFSAPPFLTHISVWSSLSVPLVLKNLLTTWPKMQVVFVIWSSPFPPPFNWMRLRSRTSSGLLTLQYLEAGPQEHQSTHSSLVQAPENLCHQRATRKCSRQGDSVLAQFSREIHTLAQLITLTAVEIILARHWPSEMNISIS